VRQLEALLEKNEREKRVLMQQLNMAKVQSQLQSSVPDLDLSPNMPPSSYGMPGHPRSSAMSRSATSGVVRTQPQPVQQVRPLRTLVVKHWVLTPTLRT
jgi:hypothetical protein